MQEQINSFIDSVIEYIRLEYSCQYYTAITNEKILDELRGFMGSYYMGGNNVPDTAYGVIQMLKSQYIGKN